MSARPGVVFACQFVQANIANQLEVEFGDHAINYLDRPSAQFQFDSDERTDFPNDETIQGHRIHYGFEEPTLAYGDHAIGYLNRSKATNVPTAILGLQDADDEMSAGVFTAQKDELSLDEKNDIRAVFNESQKRDCPLYTTVISFDNDFLQRNGIDYTSADGQQKLRDYTRLGVAKLIENSQFDPFNVTYTAAIHYNTDNIHVHVDLVELQKVERAKDMLPVQAFDALKSAVANKIVDNQYTVALSQSLRKDLISEIRIAAKEDIRHLEELLRILPRDQKWQYNRPGMQPYHAQIKAAVDNIIHSSPTLLKSWEDAIEQLDRYQGFLTDLYGEGKRNRAQEAVKNKLEDFYSRAGNALLAELETVQDKSAARTEREENSASRTTDPGIAITGEYTSTEVLPSTEIRTKREKNIDDYFSREDYIERLEHNAFVQHDPGSFYRLGQMLEHGSSDYPQNKSLAITLYERSARYGSTSGAYRLGWLYEQDKDLQNYELSEKWYRAAAAAGHHAAQYRLGRIYQYGRLGKADIALASILYEKAADDNPAAIQQLLMMHRHKQIELSDQELEYYQKQLFGLYKIQHEQDPENIFINLQLAKLYKTGAGTDASYADAVYHFGEAAMAGSPQAKSELIIMAHDPHILHVLQNEEKEERPMAPIVLKMLKLYENETATPFAEFDEQFKTARSELRKGDYETALEHLAECMLGGNVLATYELARMYQYGLGVEEDPEKAADLFRDALQGFIWIEQNEQQNPYIHYRIGKMYQYGQGSEKDGATAASWYEKAANAGNTFAQMSLGNLYYYGNGVKQDYVAASRWFQKAAEQDNPFALYKLGQMAQAGQGIAANEETADRYFKQAFPIFERKASDTLDDNLQYRCGTMVLHGIGTQADPEAAAKWLQLAADQGNEHAQCALARLYLDGEGVEQSTETAISLLTPATEKGHDQAQYILGKLYLTNDYRDAESAETLLRSSAGQGNPFAAYTLGRYFLEADQKENAVTFLKQAADQKFQPAQVTLGIHYLREKQPETAETFLKAAAEQGNELARKILEDRLSASERTEMRLPATLKQQKTSNLLQGYRHRHTLRNSLRRMHAQYDGHIRQLKAEFDYEQDLEIYRSQQANTQHI